MQASKQVLTAAAVFPSGYTHGLLNSPRCYEGGKEIKC